MRWMKWTGIVAAIMLIVACFYPWVYIESRNITITGVDAEGIRLGKPAWFHFICIFFFLVFSFTPRIWAKRMNLLVCALNIAWALRNFFVITACYGGECPVKQTAVYVLIPASLIMMVASLFPDIELKENKDDRK
jgi:uncharacterized membrane protein YuzA (DUF378 family)